MTRFFAAPKPGDPVDAYMARRLRASEEEALAANMRLRETQIELARVAAIARHFEKIVRDREEQGNQKESNDASR